MRVFQFTPLREGRHLSLSSRFFCALFQFTPLREGRPQRWKVVSANMEISIHAPPRGATAFQAVDASSNIDFNSRPSARGDSQPLATLLTTSLFQFTPLREGRQNKNAFLGGIDISIHAPPRGATTTLSVTASRLPFQFTPLREGRRSRRLLGILESHFNSRPSARGDCGGNVVDCQRQNFNSRPSARGDASQVASRIGRSISIHAPPRGATWLDKAYTHLDNISIHAPPRGATSASPNTFAQLKFQFTPLREGRRR